MTSEGQGASINDFRKVGRTVVRGARDAWSTLDAPELQTTKAPRLRGGSFVTLALKIYRDAVIPAAIASYELLLLLRQASRAGRA